MERGIPIHGIAAPDCTGALPEAADVVIVGGGVIGVMSAYFLARRGLKPLLLEKGRIAGEQSGRNWGWVRQMGRDDAELPIMVEANRIWQQIQRETNADLGLRQCGLTYVATKPADLEAYERWLPLAHAHGVDSRMLTGAGVAEILPKATGRYVGGLHTGSDMRAEPFQAVPALARIAQAAGATLRETCAVRALDVQAGHLRGVITEAGPVRADRVIVAGGAWSRLFLRRHGVSIPQLSVRATVVATDPVADIHTGGAEIGDIAFRRREDGGYTLAQGGYHEFWIGPDAVSNLRAFWPQIKADPFGRRYRAAAPRGYPDAWGTARRWSADSMSPFEACRILNPAPNMAKVAQIAEGFGALFPQLGKVGVARAWAGMIDTTPDDVPIVDRVPGLPGVFVCTGMCGHGFGIGPAFGRIMADLVTGTPPSHDLSRFRLSRFADGSAYVPSTAI